MAKAVCPICEVEKRPLVRQKKLQYIPVKKSLRDTFYLCRYQCPQCNTTWDQVAEGYKPKRVGEDK